MKLSIAKLTAVISLLLFTSPAFADAFEFDGISDSDLENIVNELSANFAFTSVSGAKPLGKIFGLEVGLIGGMTQTPEIEKLVQEQDPDAEVEGVPHGAILARISLPLGLTVEGNLTPSVDTTDFKFSNAGLAAMWTLTETVLPLPFDFAVKAHAVKTSMEYTQLLNNSSTGNTDVNVDVAFDDTIYGLQAIASYDAVVLEPYVGVGHIGNDGTMDLEADYSFFEDTTKNKGTAETSGVQYFAGLNVNLLVLNGAFEYSNQFGTDRVTAKASFSF